MGAIVSVLVSLLPVFIPLVERLFSGKSRGVEKKEAVMNMVSKTWDLLDRNHKIPNQISGLKQEILGIVDFTVNEMVKAGYDKE